MREGPDHYTRLKPEPIDVIRAWDLPWCVANVIKYCARYRNKGGVGDLKKARHYLDIEIDEPPTSTGLRIRATHHYGYRSGEWGDAVGIEWDERHSRAVVRVRFDDGDEDTWSVFEEPHHYELARTA